MKSTLSLCIQACRENVTCWSIAWVPPDTQCIFYNECVEKTDLLEDDTSPFMHWDDICDVVWWSDWSRKGPGEFEGEKEENRVSGEPGSGFNNC